MAGALWPGALALSSAAILHAVLMAGVRKADRAFPSTNPVESSWWFGYARDLSNLAGLAMFVSAFFVLGFPGSLAVLAGALLGIVSYGLDYFFGRVLSVEHTVFALGCTLVPASVTIALLRGPIILALHGLVLRLFA
jgi:hypothetical protein